MEGGGKREIIYLSLTTVPTRMTSALRWAAMRAIFNVSIIVGDKVTRQCPQTTTFEGRRAEAVIEPRSFRLPAFRLTYRPKRFSGGWFCPRTYRSMVLSERFGSSVALTGLHSARGLVNSLRGCAVVPASHGRRLVARARVREGHDANTATITCLQQATKSWTI